MPQLRGNEPILGIHKSVESKRPSLARSTHQEENVQGRRSSTSL
jgi:hypothetical protein